MKRMFGTVFCLVLAVTANAEEKLRVIDLAPDAPISAEAAERGRQYVEAQEAAAKITPDEALEFVHRLRKAMNATQEQIEAGAMDEKAQREHAIALNKLHEEGGRFGGPFAPFKSCGNASSDAAMSWQGLIRHNEDQYVEYFQKYLAAADECIQAAHSKKRLELIQG